jgi:hypothetical protein
MWNPLTSTLAGGHAATCKRKAGAFAVPHKSCCRAIKTRATKRRIAFVVADARPFEQWSFLGAGRAFDRDRRMLELWNNCCETPALAEVLAIVIVIVVVADGVITLAENWRR